MVLILIFCAHNLWAAPEDLKVGKLIPNYGKIAAVEGREAIALNTEFKVSFDVVKQASAGELNKSIVSAARFLNMHEAAGIKAENIKLALVIHGKAVHDVTLNKHYQSITNHNNLNADLISELQSFGVKIYVCGQSATYHGVNHQLLLPGVKMSLSAMTAHALLQQQGYTVNPF